MFRKMLTVLSVVFVTMCMMVGCSNEVAPTDALTIPLLQPQTDWANPPKLASFEQQVARSTIVRKALKNFLDRVTCLSEPHCNASLFWANITARQTVFEELLGPEWYESMYEATTTVECLSVFPGCRGDDCYDGNPLLLQLHVWRSDLLDLARDYLKDPDHLLSIYFQYKWLARQLVQERRKEVAIWESLTKAIPNFTRPIPPDLLEALAYHEIAKANWLRLSEKGVEWQTEYDLAIQAAGRSDCLIEKYGFDYNTLKFRLRREKEGGPELVKAWAKILQDFQNTFYVVELEGTVM